MSSATVIEFTSDNFQSEVLDADQPVLVDVWSEGCMPCKMLSPIVEKLAGTYEGKLKVGKLDAGENGEIASTYGINSVPTVLLFKGGEVQKTLSGLQKEKAYTAEIDKLLG